MLPPPRIATVVLVTRAGRLLGALPPCEVETPWWQDAGAVVRAVHARHGIPVTVLRLLSAELSAGPGGAVSYLAEIAEPDPPDQPDPHNAPIAVVPWAGTLDDHPLRVSWARPGGPACDVAWAVGMLAACNRRLAGPPQQIRTWNLSSVWRLPLAGDAGAAWLKVGPPFAAHEGRLLARLQGGPVPRALADDGARVLMAEVAGEDRYDASGQVLLDMIDRLVALQRGWIGRSADLLGLGVRDCRAAALVRAIASVVDRTSEALSVEDRETLAGLVNGLPDRLAAVAACGIPDTLIHGDFHPGNMRGYGAAAVLLDWSDAGFGHPLLDETAMYARLGLDDVAAVRAHWHAAWRAIFPACDPARASQLLAPVAAARQAAVYRAFLDRIEPSEQPYHRADPAAWLARAAVRVRRERDPARDA